MTNRVKIVRLGLIGLVGVGLGGAAVRVRDMLDPPAPTRPSAATLANAAGARAQVPRVSWAYQGIAWGSSRASAVARLGGQEDSSDHDTAERVKRLMPDGRHVELFFFEDQLWKVLVRPFSHDRIAQAVPTIRQMMEQRYGTGAIARPLYSETERQMIDLGLVDWQREALAWNNRETSIQLEYPVPPRSGDIPPASVISVTYVSDALLDARAAYLARAQATARASAEAEAARAAAEQARAIQNTIGGAL